MRLRAIAAACCVLLLVAAVAEALPSGPSNAHAASALSAGGDAPALVCLAPGDRGPARAEGPGAARQLARFSRTIRADRIAPPELHDHSRDFRLPAFHCKRPLPRFAADATADSH